MRNISFRFWGSETLRQKSQIAHSIVPLGNATVSESSYKCQKVSFQQQCFQRQMRKFVNDQQVGFVPRIAFHSQDGGY